MCDLPWVCIMLGGTGMIILRGWPDRACPAINPPQVGKTTLLSFSSCSNTMKKVRASLECAEKGPTQASLSSHLGCRTFNLQLQLSQQFALQPGYRQWSRWDRMLQVLNKGLPGVAERRNGQVTRTIDQVESDFMTCSSTLYTGSNHATQI